MQAGPSLPSYREAPPKFVAGERCLDFLNTVEWRGDAAARGERLTGYEEFLLWAAAAGYATPAELRRLRGRARRSPREAMSVLRDAVHIREAIADLAATHGGARSVDAFNRVLRRYAVELRLARVDGTVRRVPARSRNALRLPLDRVLVDAIDLVTSRRLHAVRQCGNPRCGWYFIDVSRNHSRRWCDMAACGNSAKVRAHRARLRGG